MTPPTWPHPCAERSAAWFPRVRHIGRCCSSTAPRQVCPGPVRTSRRSRAGSCRWPTSMASRPARWTASRPRWSCPLVPTDRPTAGSSMGLLVVAAAEPVLFTLRGALEVLASQTALAVERVTLSQEVTRRNNEAYFRTLVQNAHDVILIVDDGGRIRYASPSAEAVLGPGSLLARPVVDLVAPADRDAAERALSAGDARPGTRGYRLRAHGRGPHRRRGDLPRPPGRSDRPRFRAHHARRHRSAEAGAGAHPPGEPRLAHRAREPGAVPGPRRAGTGRPDATGSWASSWSTSTTSSSSTTRWATG